MAGQSRDDKSLQPQLYPKTHAKELYCLTDKDLEPLNYQEKRNPYVRKSTPMKLYKQNEVNPSAAVEQKCVHWAWTYHFITGCRMTNYILLLATFLFAFCTTRKSCPEYDKFAGLCGTSPHRGKCRSLVDMLQSNPYAKNLTLASKTIDAQAVACLRQL